MSCTADLRNISKESFKCCWNKVTMTQMITLIGRTHERHNDILISSVLKFMYHSYVLSFYAHRCLLAFIFIPVVQKELDAFCSSVRKQKDAALPKEIPDHLYCFPHAYGAEECGM